jgi:hypothetical protein
MQLQNILSSLTHAYSKRLLWFVCSYRILNCAVPGFMCHNYHNSEHEVEVEVEVRLAADSQSTSKSGYQASFWDP